jgi:hypothetical protein
MPVSIWKVPLMSEIFNRKVPCPISRVANVANEKKKKGYGGLKRR